MRSKLHRKDHVQGWPVGWLWWTRLLCAEVLGMSCPAFSPQPSFESCPLSLGKLPRSCGSLVWLKLAGHLPALFTWSIAQPCEIAIVSYQLEPVTQPTSWCLSYPGPFPIPESGSFAGREGLSFVLLFCVLWLNIFASYLKINFYSSLLVYSWWAYERDKVFMLRVSSTVIVVNFTA